MCGACGVRAKLLSHIIPKPSHLSNSLSSIPNPSTPSSPETTTIFHGGPIYTLSGSDYGLIHALVVKGSQILFAGGLNSAEKLHPNAKHHNLKGHCLLPGFIEPHVHLLLTAVTKNHYIDVSANACPTTHEVLKRIQQAVDEEDFRGEWVACFGYDPSRLEGHLPLTVTDLDAISKDVPIYVLNPSMHIAYVNTKAFQTVNPDWEGNWEYEAVDGVLTGQVFEQAVAVMGAQIAAPTEEELVEWCRDGIEDIVSKGCTTFLDITIGTSGQAELDLLEAVTTIGGPPPLRYLGSFIWHFLESRVIPAPPVTIGNITIDRVKFVTDGSTQGFTAALEEDYLDRPGQKGELNYPNDEELQHLMAKYRNKGYKLIVHANGDRAINQTLNAFEAIISANPTPENEQPGMHRIDHFTVASKQQIASTKELGIGISHTIGHVGYWGNAFHNYVLGHPRADNIDPLKWDEEIGAVWSLHSDSPVTEVNPIRYLHTAVTRLQYPDFKTCLGREQRVGLLTALKSITVNPAKQLGVDDQTGTLEVGKSADMVILNLDPTMVSKRELNTLEVVQTWYRGKKVYDRDELKV
jgi:predicted amidohydrolase YtcJ